MSRKHDYAAREARALRMRHKSKSNLLTDEEFTERNRLRRQIDLIIARAMTEVGTIVKRRILRIVPDVNISGKFNSIALTGREEQIMSLFFGEAYMTNKEIGVKMNIAERTVKFHVSNILRKFGKRYRRELLRTR